MASVTFLHETSITDHGDRFGAHPGGQATAPAPSLLPTTVAGRHVRCCS